MPLPVREIQQALQKDGIDGWLLYDFHGSNPIAARLTGLDASSKMATRRWYYLVPADGAPRGLVHAIERHNLDGLPGEKRPYAGREQLAAGLGDLLRGMKRVAMEYSPGNAIPYISRVDAGTVEAVRAARRRGGVVGRSGAALRSALDRRGARHAPGCIRRALSHQGSCVRPRPATARGWQPVNESDVQQAMVGWFDEEGLTTDDPPVRVRAGERREPALSAYRRHASRNRHKEVLLLDLWGKLPNPGAVFADITWVGFTGRAVPESMRGSLPPPAMAVTRRSSSSACGAGRTGAARLRSRSCSPRSIDSAGFGAQFIHRTGHSLGRTCTATACTSTTTRRTTSGG